MKLYIKYMVSLRCKMFVKCELEKLGINYSSIDLGIVEVQDEITVEKMEELRKGLMKGGLEIIDNKKYMLVEKIKSVIIEMVNNIEDFPDIDFSDYISQKMNCGYTYLSNIFSELNGITIKQYIILYKIEKVKEKLMYDELSLTEIAYQLNYSSAAHLSNQFKKYTGLTPSYFKEIKKIKRIHQSNQIHHTNW